jgi:RHS repeat-associated protein
MPLDAHKNHCFSKTFTGFVSFTFNGKEADNELNSVTGADLDFGARIYDSRIGRFLSVDPLQAKYPSWSTYSSFNDNPILYTDPTGKGGVVTNIRRDNNGQLQGDLVIYEYLYSDPDVDYNLADLNTLVTGALGAANDAGQWEIDGGTGTISVAGTNEQINLTVKVVVSVISYTDAKDKITNETNEANNYYYIDTDTHGDKLEHNLKGTNQGIITDTWLQDIPNAKQVLEHAPYHSVARYGNDPTDGFTYGSHNPDEESPMAGKANGNTELLQSDFDALNKYFDKNPYKNKSRGWVFQLEKNESGGYKDAYIGGGIDNTFYGSDCKDDLSEGQ